MAARELTLLVLTRALLVLCAKEEKIVLTFQGPVKGFLNDEGYFDFFGIPYATAPKDEHRFKAPLPPQIRNGVFEATRKVACPQFIMKEGNITLISAVQDEECLVVNVFVPKTEKSNLPVVVYVHGGAFVMGAGDMVDHGPLVKQEIIVVNFNYRLGVQGFLCLGTKDIPGNAGMKDQVAALRWVQSNIEHFGGDPNEVTIAGYSAGSISVEHLMLSPTAKGLFKRVIPESGSAISPWAITPDPIAVAARYMKDISGIHTHDIVELEDFYKSLSEEQMTRLVYLAEPKSSFEFVPCVEPEIEGEESFFNESPMKILKDGNYNKVPIMPGFATEEGLIRIHFFDDWSVRMDKNFSDFLPQDLTFESEEEKKHLADKIKRFYFGENPINLDNIKNYVNYFTDVLFAYSIIKASRIHAENSVPVYLYSYSYVLSDDFPYPHSDKIKGAKHCAQTNTLNRFKMGGAVTFSKEDELMQNRLATMWANFIKFGKPIPETSDLLPVTWSALEPRKVNYLHIDMTMSAEEGLLKDRVALWDSIYRQYYREPARPGSVRRSHIEL